MNDYLYTLESKWCLPKFPNNIVIVTGNLETNTNTKEEKVGEKKTSAASVCSANGIVTTDCNAPRIKHKDHYILF